MAVDNVGPKSYIGVKTPPRIPGVRNSDQRADKDKQPKKPPRSKDPGSDGEERPGGIDERV